MKPQCCAEHQPALQPPQDSLPEIGTCIMTCMKYAQCIVSSTSRYTIYRECCGNTSVHAHTYNMYVCVHTCICIYTHMYIHVYMYTHTYMRMCIYTRTYMHIMCTHTMYVCMYIHICVNSHYGASTHAVIDNIP